MAGLPQTIRWAHCSLMMAVRPLLHALCKTMNTHAMGQTIHRSNTRLENVLVRAHTCESTSIRQQTCQKISRGDASQSHLSIFTSPEMKLIAAPLRFLLARGEVNLVAAQLKPPRVCKKEKFALYPLPRSLVQHHQRSSARRRTC
jgi:hypothetical protein